MLYDLDDSEKNLTSIKVIFVGEPGVGKTNLINISVGNCFDDQSQTTLRASFQSKKIKVDNKEYNLNLWDTIGDQKFKDFSKIFYKGAHIVIIMYDITNKKTFEQLTYWVNNINEALGDDILKAIVGNKIDLLENAQVTEEEGKKFAESVGAEFKLASAKTNEQNFELFLEKLLKEFLRNDKFVVRDSIRLRKSRKSKSGKRKCCQK